MTECETLALARHLIQCPSLTPQDAGCQKLVQQQLDGLGCTTQQMRFGKVDNLWIRHGDKSPVLAFVGHTDVVPTGPLKQWRHNPFAAVVEDGILYGRGAADMKASVAAMTLAMRDFLRQHPQHQGSIALLLTSDEEGPAKDGTVRVVEQLKKEHVDIDMALIGEPSSHERTGDTIRQGRRGSLTGSLTILGRQGHVAYPNRIENPLHGLCQLLHELSQRTWCSGNSAFPPTTFQVTAVQGDSGASNVVPGEAKACFNLRFSPLLNRSTIDEVVQEALRRHRLRHHLTWHLSAQPFSTEGGPLQQACCDALLEISGKMPRITTDGGTSDGRFLAPGGSQVIELGPVNATIHAINEHVAVAEISLLHRIYQRVAEKLLGN